MVVYTGVKYVVPEMRRPLRMLIARLATKKIRASVGETYRTQDRQDALYRFSKEHPEQAVTHSRRSWHRLHRAADMHISPATIPNILTFLDVARDMGFKTVADPDKVRDAIASGGNIDQALWDWHHVSWRGGKTYQQAARESAILFDDHTPSFMDVFGVVVFAVPLLVAVNAAHKSPHRPR